MVRLNSIKNLAILISIIVVFGLVDANDTNDINDNRISEWIFIDFHK